MCYLKINTVKKVVNIYNYIKSTIASNNSNDYLSIKDVEEKYNL